MTELKKRKYIISLFFVWFFSFVIHSFLALKAGTINIIYDELLYWSMSKSLVLNGSTELRGIIISNKEILYPLLISWIHKLDGFDNVYPVILVFNSFIMTSAIFPVYKLSKEIIAKEHISLLIASVSIFLPEMFYSTRILQENLYYPVMMWMFYFFVTFIVKDKWNYLKIALFSGALCLMTYIKGIALGLIGAFAFFYFIQLLLVKDIDKKIKSVIGITEVVSVYIILKQLLDLLIKHLCNQPSGDAVSDLSYRALLRLLDVKALISYIYPCISYVVFFVLFCGVFSVIIPLAYFKFLSDKDRDLLIFVLGIGIFTMAAVCLLVIGADKEIGQRITRIHMRYFYYLFIPFWILFLKLYKDIKVIGVNRGYLVLSIIYIVFILITVPMIKQGSEIDSIEAGSLQAFFMTEQRQLLFKILIITGVCTGVLLVYKRKTKLLFICVIVALFCLFAHSTNKAYIISYDEKIALEKMNREGEILSKYLSLDNNINNVDDVLIIASNKASTGIMEIHLDVPYRVCQAEDFLSQEVWNDGDIQYKLLDFYCMDSYRIDTDIKPIYIITQEAIDINGYEKIELDISNFQLYKLSES